MASIMNYLQEAAFHHLEKRGDSLEKMAENNETWMFYKLFIKVEDYPRWKDSLQVTTWLSRFKGYKTFREFEVKNSRGDIIARSTSQAFLVDTIQRTPKRIPKERITAFGIQPQKAIEYEFKNFSMDNQPQYEKSFVVRMSDIDTNGHVNNRVYVEWFLEIIPVTVHIDYFLDSIEIIYRKEVKYGQEINVQAVEQKGENNKITYTGQIVDDTGKIATILRARFIKS